jgi:hypothetical protein
MASLTTTVSTPITLAEYAKGMPEASATRTFVENMVDESDIMRAVPFLPAFNGKKEFQDISSLPTVGFRGLNQAGNQATGTTSLRSEDTFFIDEYIYVDRAVTDRLGMGERARQERLKSTALAQMFTTKFISGDNTSTPTEPTGIKARCQIVNTNLLHNSAASGGAALSLANLDKLFYFVNKPTHWIVPITLLPQFDVAARNSTLSGQTYTTETDGFGRLIRKYKGLPVLFGYEPDDTPDPLPLTEVASGGGAAVTGSIYLISFAPGHMYAIEQTSLAVEDEGLLKGTPQYSTHIKWDWGIAREHPRSVARLTSITNAAFVA